MRSVVGTDSKAGSTAKLLEAWDGDDDWLVVDLPLWKIWVSNSWDDYSILFPIYGKIKAMFQTSRWWLWMNSVNVVNWHCGLILWIILGLSWWCSRRFTTPQKTEIRHALFVPGTSLTFRLISLAISVGHFVGQGAPTVISNGVDRVPSKCATWSYVQLARWISWKKRSKQLESKNGI